MLSLCGSGICFYAEVEQQMIKRKQQILENLIYAFIWLIMFIIPLAGYSFEGSIHWNDVRKYWERLLPFVLLFLLNNYLLIPKLLFRKKHLLYIGLLLLSILLLFIARPLLADSINPHPHPGKEQHAFHNQWENHPPMYRIPPHEERMGQAPFKEPPPGGRKKGPSSMQFPKKWGPYMNGLLMAMLVAGFNIAISLLFKSIKDAKQLDELESRTLRTELNYLKAQINPHFFMNTLNNIHALIDIDGRKAKRTVVELSKLMRYVLYEAEKSQITLEKEVEFIENYIALMRIRYTEDVEITSLYPQVIPPVQIPPLLLITLIENAFKHGINVSGKSYIHSQMTIEDEHLLYSVVNTLPVDPISSTKGVGLDNMRKRLELLFGKDNYMLETYAGNGVFIANLDIPVKT